MIAALVAPRLITEDPGALTIPWATLGAALLIALVIAGAVVLYRRERDRASAADRAVRRLARVLGLDDRERSTLFALASASGIHASALLVSRRAFERAMASASSAPRPPKPAFVRSLSQKVHPGLG